MSKLLNKISKRDILLNAWKKISENAYSSSSVETREAAREFASDLLKNINKIQRELRNLPFNFNSHKGITILKKNGKKRGIIISSIRNRVVERAILDVLQSDIEFIKKVNTTKTSVGGVPERNVPHALKIINDSFKDRENFSFFARSDISKFFDNINPNHFSSIMTQELDDDELIQLICDAMKVNLINEVNLGEDRKLFPSDKYGIPQGSPLSPLVGNVILHKFDECMNMDNLVCIRYIDDFLILGKSESEVRKGFNKAEKWLKDHGFECANPYAGKSSTKAERGRIGIDNFIFLGYLCEPGRFQPTKAAKIQLLEKIRYVFNSATKLTISDASYIKALQTVSSIIKGWGNAYAYSNNPQYMKDIDKEIFSIIKKFKYTYWNRKKISSEEDKLRMLGMSLLQDILPKNLDHIPRKLNLNLKRWSTKERIEVSTDGAYRKYGSASMGAWAVVFHDACRCKYGTDVNTTSNRMELKAVIEAINSTYPLDPLEIYTDSSYVSDAINKKNIIKNNFDLWEELEKLSAGRKIKFTKVKGHSGNTYNEKADELATKLARDELNKTTKR